MNQTDTSARLMAKAPCGAKKGRWWQHAAAALAFVLLIWWHFAPLFPHITTHVPTGGTYDVYNFTAAPLTVVRAMLRTPWRFWRGDRPFPDDFATTLHQVDYPYAFSYYLLYLVTGNPLLVFNLCAMLLFFANACALYVLVRCWSGEWLAALFASCFCAFYSYGFFCMELDIQVMYVAALALLCWLAWLQRGGRMRLALFFCALALKTTTPDYQGVFLALLFSVAVPLGFLAYPERWRGERVRFVIGSAVFVALMLPFIYPYVRVLTRYRGHGWRGVLFVNCAYLTADAWRGVFSRFWHVITHPRTQTSPDPSYFLWPGALWQICAAAGLVWGVLSPWVYGRRALVRWALVLGAALAFCVAFASQIRIGSVGTLARLYVDPPVLALVRAPRAFIFSTHVCLAVLAGLAAGDLLRAARTYRWSFCAAAAGLSLLIALYTMENTVVLRPLTRYDILRDLPPAYQWLRTQSYPSPFIEFPYHPGSFDLYIKGALGALADQPSAKGRSRYVHPLQYFLSDMNALPLTNRATFVSVSPYRFWLQDGAGEEERRVVEAASDLRYATNFGRTMIFENPAPCKARPVSMVITQHYAAVLPNCIYALFIAFTNAEECVYIPESERRLYAKVKVLDKEGRPLARLCLHEELPFVLNGREWHIMLHLQYERARRRLVGRCARPGAWRIAKAPEARTAFSDEKLHAARWLEITATRPDARQTASVRVPVSLPSPRWPYQFGTPVSYPYQAGGFDFNEMEERPLQRSLGRTSTLFLPRPDHDANALAFTLRSAVPFVKEGVEVRVTLNDVLLGSVRASTSWEQHVVPVPSGAWRDVNVLVFTYPRTFVPCITQGGDDDKHRCVAFAEIAVAAIATPPAAAPQAQIALMTRGSNLIRNASFSAGLEGWQPWRHGVAHTNLLSVRHEGGQTFVRIENPLAQLIGVQQTAVLRSATVYRVRASARAPQNDPRCLWGARVAVYLPPQPEHALVWMYQDNTFTTREMVFTNQTDGVATVYAHMGFGNIAATGEFTGIAVEQLTYVEAPTNTIIRSDAEGRQHTYTSVLAALRGARDGDEITIYPGTYREENAGAEWVMSHRRDVRVRGIGMPVIEVDAHAPGYQISMQAPYNERLTFEGIVLHTHAYACSNNVLYGLVVTGSRDVLISNCVLWADIYSTNATFKHVVAVNNATNVLVQDSVIVTRDAGAGNVAWHAASHDAGPLIFERCRLRGLPRARISIGGYELRECEVEENCPQGDYQPATCVHE